MTQFFGPEKSECRDQERHYRKRKYAHYEGFKNREVRSLGVERFRMWTARLEREQETQKLEIGSVDTDKTVRNVDGLHGAFRSSLQTDRKVDEFY